jgi:very-short-patch-repair endonuclease
MLKSYQKELRRNRTEAESRLWYYLRDRRLLRWKFRRQHIIENYIVDFVCLETKLVIELDGSQHIDQATYDNHRTRVLERNGFKVIRFWNNDVLSNIEGVLEMIVKIANRPLRD